MWQPVGARVRKGKEVLPLRAQHRIQPDPAAARLRDERGTFPLLDGAELLHGLWVIQSVHPYLMLV